MLLQGRGGKKKKPNDRRKREKVAKESRHGKKETLSSVRGEGLKKERGERARDAFARDENQDSTSGGKDGSAQGASTGA